MLNGNAKNLMNTLCRAIAALLLVGSVCASGAAEPMDRAVQQAQMLVDRMKAFDSDGMLAWTYTRFFERMKIDPERLRNAVTELNAKLKSVEAVYTRFELQPNEKPFAGDEQLYVIIPYSQIMEAKGRRLLQEAFFIGVSEDQGQNWKFVDGISATQDNIRMVIPSYSGAPLPPRRQKSLE